MRRRRGSRSHVDVIREIVVNRRRYEINVNSDGEFTAYVAGDHIRHDTLKATMSEIRRRAKKLEVRISIPVTVLGHGRRIGRRLHRQYIGDVHHGTIIEYDDDSSEYKIRFDDGGLETFSRWGGRVESDEFTIAKPMSQAEVKEWARLRDTKRKASDRYEEYTRRFTFKDVHSVVKDAYEAAIDQPNEKSEIPDDDPR